MRILVVCVLAALFFVVVPGDAKKQRRKRARCSVNDNFNQLTVESTIENASKYINRASKEINKKVFLNEKMAKTLKETKCGKALAFVTAYRLYAWLLSVKEGIDCQTGKKLEEQYKLNDCSVPSPGVSPPCKQDINTTLGNFIRKSIPDFPPDVPLTELAKKKYRQHLPKCVTRKMLRKPKQVKPYAMCVFHQDFIQTTLQEFCAQNKKGRETKRKNLKS